jgi:hypothetical protein
MKIYTMEQIIKKNQTLVRHDTWGRGHSKLYPRYCRYFFTRTPTENEVYKEKLFSMKQDEVKAQETTPPSPQQSGHR